VFGSYKFRELSNIVQPVTTNALNGSPKIATPASQKIKIKSLGLKNVQFCKGGAALRDCDAFKECRSSSTKEVTCTLHLSSCTSRAGHVREISIQLKIYFSVIKKKLNKNHSNIAFWVELNIEKKKPEALPSSSRLVLNNVITGKLLEYGRRILQLIRQFLKR